ncbi:MAG TPA: LysM peptidoglycan-binding domain-containing protein [Dehalococcoidia bacterium]|nr:LysM peptidoglycan-binding domain-containing protein [Dehalococcoidia bacterium]
MLRSGRATLTASVYLVAVVATGCSARTASRLPDAVSAAPAVQTVPASAPEPVRQADPATEFIALSTLLFEAGQHELELGHLEAAKGHFNSALEVLLESPFGGRTEPRIREHFDQLVGRISAYEVTALAQGDGFAEQRNESATIDEILTISTFEAPAASVETTQAVTADLEAIVHDIDIPLNAKVLSFVQLFSGRLKSYLEEGLARGAQFLPMIQDVFRAEGLPLDLAYVPLVESAFKPTALSRAKAKGIWQFMRGTALENGLTHDWYIDERAEPEKSTRAAAKYLKTLHQMFDGDWHLALASYNGGPGRVQRAMKRSGRTDFWKLSATTRYLPRETRDYVPLILAAIIVARNPGQYGVNIQPLEQMPVESVPLSSAVDLRRVAEWLAMPVQLLQDLNPELRRWTTPVRATDYELKVPTGTGDIVRAHLAQTAPDDLAPLNWHTVKKGETLLSIAKKLKVNRTDLAEANYLSTRAKVATGQRLIIPRAPALLAARTDNPPPDTESRQVDATLASNAAPVAGEPEQASLVYRVKRGDTLFAIAKLYRTTVASLKSWNRLRTNSIKVGQRLTIFLHSTATATN